MVVSSAAAAFQLAASAQRDASERLCESRASVWHVRREAAGTATAQGKREHQEDRVAISKNAVPGVDLYALFDGHGGSRCSQIASQVFAKAFAAHAERLHVRASVAAWRAAVKAACRDTEAEYVAATRHKRNVYEGSTAVFAAVRHLDVRGGAGTAKVDGEPEPVRPSPEGSVASWFREAYDPNLAIDRHALDVVVGNIGDSRCVLCRHSGVADVPGELALTRDHKPQILEEASRIVLLGGHVVRRRGGDTWRVYDGLGRGGLAMSRALGDTFYAEAVPATPEVLIQPLDLHSDLALVLASDGVWDVLSNRQVCDVVRATAAAGAAERDKDAVAKRAAQSLVDTALKNKSTDNCTAIVVLLGAKTTERLNERIGE